MLEKQEELSRQDIEGRLETTFTTCRLRAEASAMLMGGNSFG
jgi:hypothetical protein